MPIIPEEDVIIPAIWDDYSSSFDHENTEAVYYSDLVEFYMTVKKEFSEADKTDVSRYLDYLTEKILAGILNKSTAERKIRELSSISLYIEGNASLYGLNYKYSFGGALKRIKEIPLIKNLFSSGEKRDLLSAASADQRDYTIIFFACHGHLLSDDIISLKTKDVILENDHIIINKKISFKGDPVSVEFTESRIYNKDSYFFINSRGNMLNQMYLSRLMKKYSDISGIKRRNFNLLAISEKESCLYDEKSLCFR